MAHITLRNNTGQNLYLTLPNGSQEVFAHGSTKTGTLTGHYIVKNGTITLTSVEFLYGTISVTIDQVTRMVSILYLQVGCQAVRLYICL